MSSIITIIPDKEGVWSYKDEHGEIHEVDVYLHPSGHLCVWCQDVGIVNYEQIFTDGDEIYGHIPVQVPCVYEWLNIYKPFPEETICTMQA